MNEMLKMLWNIATELNFVVPELMSNGLKKVGDMIQVDTNHDTNHTAEIVDHLVGVVEGPRVDHLEEGARAGVEATVDLEEGLHTKEGAHKDIDEVVERAGAGHLIVVGAEADLLQEDLTKEVEAQTTADPDEVLRGNLPDRQIGKNRR